MRCPMCFSDETKVTDTKKSYRDTHEFSLSHVPKGLEYYDYILRRRKCSSCGYSFVTIESYADDVDKKKYNENIGEFLFGGLK